VGAELFHADGRTDGETRDEANIRNFANASKKLMFQSRDWGGYMSLSGRGMWLERKGVIIGCKWAFCDISRKHIVQLKRIFTTSGDRLHMLTCYWYYRFFFWYLTTTGIMYKWLLHPPPSLPFFEEVTYTDWGNLFSFSLQNTNYMYLGIRPPSILNGSFHVECQYVCRQVTLHCVVLPCSGGGSLTMRLLIGK
jgi:hypothetical protein